MSRVITVSRISKLGDTSNQRHQLMDYSRNVLLQESFFHISHTGSAWNFQAKFYQILRKKLKEVNNNSRGEPIELVFTVPDRLSRNLNQFQELLNFIELKQIFVNFHFINFPEFNFSYSYSNKRVPEGLIEMIKNAETESKQRSLRASLNAKMKRERNEENRKTKKWIWVNLYHFIKESLTEFDTFGGSLESFYTGVQTSIKHHYGFSVPKSEIKRYHDMISDSDLVPQNGLIVCTQEGCNKIRWTTIEVCDYYNNNPESQFTCSMLQGCKCSYSMMDEESHHISEESGGGGLASEEESTESNDGGGGFAPPDEENMEPEEEEPRYIIKSIMERRIRNGKTEYLVWWKGYSIKNSTWEPEERLIEDVPVLLHQYNLTMSDYHFQNMNLT